MRQFVTPSTSRTSPSAANTHPINAEGSSVSPSVARPPAAPIASTTAVATHRVAMKAIAFTVRRWENNTRINSIRAAGLTDTPTATGTRVRKELLTT